MSQAVGRFLLMVVFAGVVLSLLAGIIWSWIRWARAKQPRTLSSILSLIGLTLATASAALALSSIAVPGFIFEGVQLLGFELSLAGVLFAVGGAWRPGSLRWNALGCAVGMFLFWLLSLVSG